MSTLTLFKADVTGQKGGEQQPGSGKEAKELQINQTVTCISSFIQLVLFSYQLIAQRVPVLLEM